MPMLKTFERAALTFDMTSTGHLPRLSETLGDEVEIHATREDRTAGPAMGGNKLHGLPYAVPGAQASGADTLVAIGGVQPNHAPMVAATGGAGWT